MLLLLPRWSPPWLPSFTPSTTHSLSPTPPHFNPRRRFSRPAISAARDADTFTEKSGYLFELSESEAELVTEYDVGKIGAVYRKKPLVLMRRVFQIGSTLGKWFAVRYIDGVMETADAMFKVRASELRKILVELGPAYVKIAQAISSRADLIPPSYLDELSLLQDRITPFSTEVAFNTIEQELGLAIDDLFSEISAEPVAAASLGQVYQARLRPSGQVVAVKVQRPGVKAAISLDILILRFLAGVVRRAGKFNTDLQAVVDEWASSLFREMDYRREAENGSRFRELYGGLPDVVVPQMYMDKTTQKVLVMEWVEGQKLVEVKDLYLIEVGVYCSFNQLLEYGFYHADPHPGNLLRTYEGKLAYLDFGMMGEFKQELRDGFIEACLHLVNRDFDALARDFVTLGLLPPTAERDAVTKALTGVFQNAVAKGVRNISFGDLLGNLGTTMYKFKFRIPSYFSLVIRSLAVLEGIAIGFNPDYKVLGSTYPWIARKVLMGSSPKLRASLKTLLYKEGVLRIDRLESLISESLRARTDKALVKAQEFDTRLVSKEILYFTLSEQGSFVRDIVVKEIAKGLDALGLVTLNSVASIPAAYLPVPVFTVTEEDITNLRNLQRLVLLLSRPQNLNMEVKMVPRNQRLYMEEVPQVLGQLSSIQEILPLLSAVNEAVLPLSRKSKLWEVGCVWMPLLLTSEGYIYRNRRYQKEFLRDGVVLPLDLQRQFYSLPADITSRLLSRVAARTLRRIFQLNSMQP